ncbi:MAG TPA: glycosyl hydrolase [Candidatus Brocadiia bacterium]|nr:glycosyl hydrolase [Candidatus Brocadiia bacterium]
MDLGELISRVGGDRARNRPALIWSWNDLLDKKELKRQIREIQNAGFGSCLINPRPGLLTPFQGKQWMEALADCMAEARKSGFLIWLFDLGCEPADQPKRMVLDRFPEFRSSHLILETIFAGDFIPNDDVLAVYRGDKSGNIFQRCADTSKLPGQCRVHVIRKLLTDDIDVLNDKAVLYYIRQTYGAYSRKFASEFAGLLIREPHYNPVPWSPVLAEAFRRLRGYDILDHLPAIFFKGRTSMVVRYDFWRTISELFCAAFSGQFGKICQDRGIMYAGSLKGAGNLWGQVAHSGDAMMHYRHQQLPTITCVGRRTTTVTKVKECSSAARQQGLARSAAHVFGCAGWNIPLEELKWMAEYYLALGADAIAEHHALYSLRGERKRDHPPSLFHQQPYWDRFRLLNDYLARLIGVLREGARVANVLLLHSIESAWTVYSPEEAEPAKTVDETLKKTAHTLLGVHCDFDFGNEAALADNAKVVGGKLQVGACQYDIVVIPPAHTLRRTTCDLLSKFSAAGGKIALMGPLPAMADGRPSEEPKKALKKAISLNLDDPELQPKLKEVLKPCIEILDQEGRHAHKVLCHHRESPDRCVVFLYNLDRDTPRSLVVRIMDRGRFYFCDPETGVCRFATARKTSGKWLAAEVELPAMGSTLLILDRKARTGAFKKLTRKPVEDVFALPDKWEIEALDHNALLLDYASYRFGGKSWEKPSHVLKIAEASAEKKAGTRLQMRFSFTCRIEKANKLFLGIENPGAYDLSVNDHPVSLDPVSSWRDVSIQLVDIVRHVKPGLNEILLTTTLTAPARVKCGGPDSEPKAIPVEPEAIYLIGDFAVKSERPLRKLYRRGATTEGKFYLAPISERGSATDLHKHGLLFFAGSVRLTQEFPLKDRLPRRCILSFADPNAAIMRVRINNQDFSTLWKRPYEIDISGAIRRGQNIIEVILTSSARNLFGPHHHVRGEPQQVSPLTFRGRKTWTDDEASPQKTWTDRYCFVPFGLGGPVTIISSE